MSGHETISITAHYTAQVWVKNGLPEAAPLDTFQGRALYWLAYPFFAVASRCGLTTPHEFLLQRHLLMDALLEQLAPAQVIELGCGLSPRAIAYCRRRSRPVLDVDLPDLLRLKARLLESRLVSRYHLVPLDLIESQDYARDLRPALQALAPTVVLAEGLLTYYSLPLQQKIFERVCRLLQSCGGGTFITDVHHQMDVDRLGTVARLFMRGLHQLARTEQHRMIAHAAQGRQMLQQAGFSSVQLHRPADWEARLNLPVRPVGAGLWVYEAQAAGAIW
jgi:O-methyltransferase involved in polyketide biosynthesis